MKERPILFSAPMIRANRAGRKTQTRRLINPQPIEGIMDKFGWDALRGAVEVGLVPSGESERRIGWTWGGTRIMPWPRAMRTLSPFGYPGDCLVVRETWRADKKWDEYKPSVIFKGDPIWYEADAGGERGPRIGKLRPSIFLPRWASRDTYEVTEVRVERVTEISEADAIAEGIDPWPSDDPPNAAWTAIDSYRVLWDSLNGKRAPWSSAPWVWAVSYKPVAPR